jgi:hypothetical protein
VGLDSWNEQVIAQPNERLSAVESHLPVRSVYPPHEYRNNGFGKFYVLGLNRIVLAMC